MAAPAVARLSSSAICISCRNVRITASSRILASLQHQRGFSHVFPQTTVQRGFPKARIHSHSLVFKDYFSANTSIERGWVNNGLLATARTVAERSDTTSNAQHRLQAQTQEDVKLAISESKSTTREPDTEYSQPDLPTTQDLPHRRRQRRKMLVDGQAPAPANAEAESPANSQEESLPLDASSQLTTAATSLPTSATFRRKAATYLSLTKPRLSFLILLSTTSAYSLYPIPDILSTTASSVDTSFSTSTLTLLFLTTGTFLSCACANTFNMLFEPKYDALMTRTRNRPLVRKLISPRAAAVFAILCGTSGLLLLGLGTNPTVAGLSALNIFLYAGVYTPMKRLSPANTWVGAIVGGIPPLMGWCAAGQAATSEHHSWQDMLFSENALGGWGLAALLFAWQFPHFMSLSHTIREDYRNAGHKMLAWTNPARNARVALRYSIAMFPICGFLYWSGYVNPGFLAISTACNVWMTREAIRFWRKQGAGGSARGLFWASVWQLPLVLVGALVCKKGIWDGFFGSNEPISIYDDKQPDQDDDDLGMESASLQKKNRPPGDMNMAMIGFKRPT